MKKAIRILSFLLALLLTMSMAACGGQTQTDDPQQVGEQEDTTTLDIMILHKGYGFAWLQALKEGFEKANPGVSVNLTTISKADIIRGDIKNYKKSKVDLYFDVTSSGMAGLVQEYSTYYGGKQALRPLNDVLDTVIPGEDITVKEKMYESLLVPYQAEGRATEDTADDVYYGLPYVQSALGLYYNETVINEALGEGKWEVPNTTDELIALCQKLAAADCHILLPGELDQYAKSLFVANWAQYEGFDNWLKFYEGIGYDADRGRESQLSSLIYQQEGRLKALEVAYDLISMKQGFILSNTAEIGVNNLNDYQKRFVDSKNKLAIYPCGDWLMQEIVDNGGGTTVNSTIKFMKTPVISSIIDSTDGYSSSDEKRLPNIADDATLSAVVDYVDGKTDTLPAGVTEAEAEYVKNARNTVGSMSDIHAVYAPEFSNAKTLANKFLVYMASDEGISLFKANCNGGFAPYKHTYTDLNDTEQSIYEATKDAIYVGDYKFHELFYFAGAKGMLLASGGTLDSYITSPATQYPDAQALFQQFITDNSGQKWDSILSKIGG